MAASPNYPSRECIRRGQSLVEFAVVALVTYMLLAAILTFGFYFYAAQGLQQAVDLAAREISRTPLPADPTYSLEIALRGNANTDPNLAEVRKRVFDEHYLVLDVEEFQGRANLQELIADLPLANQQLVPLMISDRIGGRRVLRYPGAVFADSDTSDDPADPPPSGFLVAIPLVVARSADGVETVDWIPVAEEIDSDANADPFLITSEQRGVVALRFNYPFQAAAMSSFRHDATAPDYPFEPTVGRPNVADDGAVTIVDEDGYSPVGTPVQSDYEYGAYAGSFGLGQQAALGQQVRPFRRVISSQAIYRREVFQ